MDAASTDNTKDKPQSFVDSLGQTAIDRWSSARLLFCCFASYFAFSFIMLTLSLFAIPDSDEKQMVGR